MKERKKMKQGEKKIDFKYNLKEYLSLLSNYKFLFGALVITILIYEALALANSFFFKRIIDDGTLFLAGSLTRDVFTNTLVIIAVLFVSVSILRVVSRWVNIHFLNHINGNLMRDLKAKYFSHILGLSHKFHTSHKTGSLISRLGRGSSAIESMTDILAFNFSPLILQVIAVGSSLLFFDKLAALIVFLIAISFISYSFYIQKVQESSKLNHNASQDDEKAMIGDIFTNIDSVKYFGKEYGINKKFGDKIEQTKSAAMKNWGYFRWFDAGQIAILAIGTFFMLYFPLMKLLNGQLTVGELTFIYTIYGNIIGPMYSFVWGLRGFYRVMADMQDLFEYGKAKNDIKDKVNAPRLKINDGTIEFKDIDFSYGKKKLFTDFNLKIKKNEKVALVGHSGCGKSSLVKLLYRFHDVDSGKILVDGKKIKDVKQESLRSEMSIVPQECVLFDDTIYNNILFADPNASKEEVFAAIKFAQLDTIINEFEEKEQTIVGERGVKLSGGEKQRVSIARAILANKKILVLDEATSALDSETEYEIQKDLEKLLVGRTSIIIAHRLSTIMKADRIIVMKKGEIIEEGSHFELIKKRGAYYKLWRLQKSGFIK